MRRASIAIVAASVVAVAVSSPAGAGTATVYAPKDCVKPKVEPHRITLTCGDASVALRHIDWSDWNGPKAKGIGELFVNDCDPNCSEGTVHSYGAKVKLLNIRTTTCGGRSLPMYRRAHIRFIGEGPPHAGSLNSFKLFCNA